METAAIAKMEVEPSLVAHWLPVSLVPSAA
jgi:hypothetical protein